MFTQLFGRSKKVNEQHFAGVLRYDEIPHALKEHIVDLIEETFFIMEELITEEALREMVRVGLSNLG